MQYSMWTLNDNLGEVEHYLHDPKDGEQPDKIGMEAICRESAED